MEERYAVVSCHVERPLDDAVWHRFSHVQAKFRVAALMRPPDEAAGEDAELWLARARIAATHGTLGHHTHWGGPSQARPLAGNPAERVRREGRWLREHGLSPTVFCGGGWYLDADVASAAAELGYADCTATAFRPRYLGPESPRLEARAPCRLALGERRELLELPTTHSVGMLARSLVGRRRPAYLHLYFHDTDLLDRARAGALRTCLRVLARRYARVDLDELVRQARQFDLPLNPAFAR